MTYKIPAEDDVADAILIVMHKNPQVRSQRELVSLVRKQLRSSDPELRVGGERVRRVGINRGLINFTIEYNKSKNGKKPELCPVCRNRLKPVKNMTLDGSVIEVRRNCTVCSFSVGPSPIVPGRYFFSKKSR